MSPKCLPEKLRREIIRENILTHNYEKLAELCYCSKRTIIRTINKWRTEQGGFEELLFDEFIQSYSKIKKEFPDKAFDRLCFLLGKTLTRKVEAHTIEEVKVEEKHVSIVADYTKAIEAAVYRDIQAVRAKQQVDSTQAHASTS